LVAARPDVDRNRIVAIGQSLGGAISLSAVAALADEIPVQALVVDSSPSDFRGIAREKLAGFWLTWPFQVPLSWTIPSRPRPMDGAADLAKGETTRLLIVHGDRDGVVPARHGIAIAGAAPGAELLIVPDADHIQAFEQAWVRRRVTAFLRSALPRPSGGLEARLDDRLSPPNRTSLATRNPGTRWISPRPRRSHADTGANRSVALARRRLR
jgi:pimeloyl-ACP methyl ester carboxylesterase